MEMDSVKQIRNKGSSEIQKKTGWSLPKRAAARGERGLDEEAEGVTGVGGGTAIGVNFGTDEGELLNGGWGVDAGEVRS